MSKLSVLPSSFRDPSGFLFELDGTLYRQVNQSYLQDYEHLMESGLYQSLVKEELLIPHVECDLSLASSDHAARVIRPERLAYISYPYEWSFSELKDAALLTLRVQLLALKHGMILKDASAYNVQFYRGRPVFIDTLSFERYSDGPWLAYKQFCQHFFGPLCLCSYTDQRLSQLFRIYIDGPPLDLVSRLLPAKTWFRYSILAHIHVHARSQQRFANIAEDKESVRIKARSTKVSLAQVTAITTQLEASIQKLRFNANDTEWGDYYENTNYHDAALECKKNLVREYLSFVSPAPVMIQDIGANDGTFSRIAAESCANVVSQDIDHAAVEKNYLRVKKHKEKNILPLLLDLTNPSPGLGWANEERCAALTRSKCDVLMALALIHHIAISNNVPLNKIGYLFSQLCKYLIIEFVPKQDSQVKRLLTTRDDVFPDYTIEGFELAFCQYFTIERCTKVDGTERHLYLMKILPGETQS